MVFSHENCLNKNRINDILRLYLNNNQKINHIAMAEKIKYVGLVLLVIGAIILLASQMNGWNNINGVNFGATAAMIVGLITYVVAGKKGYQQ